MCTSRDFSYSCIPVDIHWNPQQFDPDKHVFIKNVGKDTCILLPSRLGDHEQQCKLRVWRMLPTQM